MQAALTRLRETEAPLAELASRLGYDSEAAFSRAFKRVMGESPGAARRAAAAEVAQAAGWPRGMHRFG
jgi:AraC-like DNA-binding protein